MQAVLRVVQADITTLAVDTIVAAPALPVIQEVVFCCHLAAGLAVCQTLLADAAS